MTSKKTTQSSVITKIYETGIRFLVPVTPEETFKVIVEEAKKLLDSDYTSLFLEKKGNLYRVHISGTISNQLKVRKNGFTYKAFKSGQPIINSRAEVLKYHPELGKSNKTQTFINLPLSYRGKSIGVINLQSSKKITKDKISVLKLFGSMASLAIRNSELYSATTEALKARDIFISMAAHELRTPLTSIQGYGSLIYKKLSEGKIPKIEWSKTLLLKSLMLTQTVNKLLEVDKIKTEKFEYKWKEYEPKKLAQNAMKELKTLYPHYVINYNFEVDPESMIIADEDKITQVLTNILTNAAQFSNNKNEINFSLAEERNAIIYTIQDQGRGIAKEDLHEIFTKFYKPNNSKHESLGLGLYLSNIIISHHQGKIKIKSKVNHGTTVQIYLPKLRT